jgi:hypothetical protein
VRTIVVTIGFALLASLSTTVAWVTIPDAAAGPQAKEPAIVAGSARATTASRADGSTRVELPWMLPGDTGAAVSPDGRRLAFSSARAGSTELYVADARTATFLDIPRESPILGVPSPQQSPMNTRHPHSSAT